MKKSRSLVFLSVCLLIVLLLLSVYFAIEQSSSRGGLIGKVIDGTEIKSMVSRCTDTDGGVFSKIPGVVKYRSLFGTISIKDSCAVYDSSGSGSGIYQPTEGIVERYCDSRGRLASVTIPCIKGTVCQKTIEGAACLPVSKTWYASKKGNDEKGIGSAKNLSQQSKK